jgi:4-alpha-glucanotransferase
MDDLARRAAEWGVDWEYVDARGQPRQVAPHALKRVLEVVAGAQELPTRRLLPRTVVVRSGRTSPILGSERDGLSVRWRVRAGTTRVLEGAADPTGFSTPTELPIGTFDLELTDALGESEVATLLVAPPRAYQGGSAHRIFVLGVQLYAVRSRSNWGIGDFTDLAALLRLCADLGGAGIALNPLHALFEDAADRASPYSPNSRVFLNPLYIDLSAVPEFIGLDALELAERDRLRETDFIDYRGVAALKRRALRLAYETFTQSGNARRKRDFEAFCRSRGRALSRFAAFETLRRRFDCPWWDWPPEWRQPDDLRIRQLSAEDRELRFHKFVQWLADRQLRECRVLASRLKLSLGLFLDVAVGVDAAGADAWSAQGAVVRELSVGAPPDIYNPAGQDWGLAAFNPHQLEAQKFQVFRRTIAAVMRYAGAIRLDHVLGFARLFLIPHGCPPREGTYVRYPLEALLAVVAQESMRHKCVVVGEDLGTVPENLRASLADWGIWSYLVMMFERDANGAFRSREEYVENALVTFTTHDLPTFAGWWSGHDLQCKRALGIDPGETESQRQAARVALTSALTNQGIVLPPGQEALAVTRYLAATPTRLLVVSIEDALGLKDQPNIPGTVDEYPNWRRRLPLLIEELSSSEPLNALKRVLAQSGRSTQAKNGS